MNDVQRALIRAAVQPQVIDFIQSLFTDHLRTDVITANGRGDTILDELDFRAETMIGVRETINEYIANVLSSRNYQQPFEQLPVEVLGTIFHYVLEDEKPQTYYRRLYILALVSRHWKTTIDQDPSLWSIVQSQYQIDLMDTILRRSGSHPLSVFMQDERLAQPARYLHFMQTVPLQAGRWKVAILDRVNDIQTLRPLISTPAPHLEWLSLCCDGPEIVDPEWRQFFGGLAGRLKAVQLEGSGVAHWTFSPVLSGLTRLSLELMRSVSLTASDVLYLILRNPNLQVLRLDDIGEGLDSMPRRAFVIPSVPIVLEQLKELSLRNLSETLLCMVLDTFDVPNCSDFDLDVTCNHIPGSLARPFTWMKERCPTYARFAIGEHNSVDCELSLLSDGIRLRYFNISCLLDELSSPFPWLATIFTGVDIHPVLRVYVDRNVDLEHAIGGRPAAEYLGEVPHIKDLRLSGDNSDIRSLVRMLTEPEISSPAGGTAQWRLPHLKNISLPGTAAGSQDILGMVRARYGKTKIPGVKRKKLPIPFNFLTVRHGVPNNWAKLRALLGDTIIDGFYDPVYSD